MSLTATYSSSYRKQGGRLIRVFVVKGTAKEMEQYKLTQGENFREQDGKILYFTPANNPDGTLRMMKPTINLTITQGDNPRVVIDDQADVLNAMAKAQELLPQTIANEWAKQMFTAPSVSTASVSAPAAQPTTVQEGKVGATTTELEASETLGD